MSAIDKVATLDKLFVQQKFTLMVNTYRISSVADDGQSEGEPLVYVKQKRMKVREQIDFFEDEDQKQLALRIKARSVFEFRGRSDVQLPDGTVIGQLQKVFGTSLLRSTWELLDTGGNVVATAHESSMFMAVLRRVWSSIPVANSVPFFLPFHFDIYSGGKLVGKYIRLPALVDRYLLDLTGDTERNIDRRVALAFTIALDALQDR